MSSRLAPYQLQMEETTSLIAQAVMPNMSLNADVPGAALRARTGPPVSLFR